MINKFEKKWTKKMSTMHLQEEDVRELFTDALQVMMDLHKQVEHASNKDNDDLLLFQLRVTSNKQLTTAVVSGTESAEMQKHSLHEDIVKKLIEAMLNYVALNVDVL